MEWIVRELAVRDYPVQTTFFKVMCVILFCVVLLFGCTLCVPGSFLFVKFQEWNELCQGLLSSENSRAPWVHNMVSSFRW